MLLRLQPKVRYSGTQTYVIRLVPIHAILFILLVHLLLACKLAAPVRELTFQTYRNPSFGEPRLAKYCESGDQARHLTPKVCSASAVRGVSEGASYAVEKISTRGLYPV